jgi:heme/copper-type cytochrome/quinol oxidase subunit 2
MLCAGALAVFLAIQIRIVRETSRAVRDAIRNPENAEFGLSLPRERFWTALPIAITVAVAIVALPVWRALW